MANEVQEYQQVQDENYEVVEIPKGDWTGESLKHGLVNSYFYFDIFKNLTNGKPIKIKWAGFSLILVFATLFFAVLAYQWTSTVSVFTGIISAFLVSITLLWLAWLNIKPSSDTTLLVDSIRTFFYLIKSKPSLNNLRFKAQVKGNQIIFDNGKSFGEAYVVEGVVNKSMLARDLVAIYTDLENLLPNLGEVTMIQSSQIERVEFTSLKEHYREIRRNPNSTKLQKKLAQIKNRRVVDVLKNELTQKEVVIFVASKEDELEKGRNFLRFASEKGVIASYMPMTKTNLERLLDRL
jgi:hypothetical protein